eukprot:6210726-Pleurochrysis_carterae.AAC.1
MRQRNATKKCDKECDRQLRGELQIIVQQLRHGWHDRKYDDGAQAAFAPTRTHRFFATHGPMKSRNVTTSGGTQRLTHTVLRPALCLVLLLFLILTIARSLGIWLRRRVPSRRL